MPVSTGQKAKAVETNDNYLPAENDAAAGAAVYAVPFEIEANAGAGGSASTITAHMVRTPNPLYQSADGAPPPTQVVRIPNPMHEAAGCNNTYDTNTS